MKNMTIEQLVSTPFVLQKDPILAPFDASIVVADPSLLTPDMAIDGKWHMFFHTTFGVYHFDSTDGLHFERVQKIAPNAMRPNINKVGDTYYLFYEKTRPLLANALNLIHLTKWKSGIYVVKSQDLLHWSQPQPVLTEANGYECSRDGDAISNPFLLQIDGKFRLYFSCGLTYIKDCKFCEPTYIYYAESDQVDAGYKLAEKPIIVPDENDPYLNLCSGCLKVYKMADGYIGIQNGLYLKDGKSHSAILMLSSQDGIKFDFVKVFIEPDAANKNSWMHQFVYASHLVRWEDKLRIYFNARNTTNLLKGRECIGYAEADISAK